LEKKQLQVVSFFFSGKRALVGCASLQKALPWGLEREIKKTFGGNRGLASTLRKGGEYDLLSNLGSKKKSSKSNCEDGN